MFCMQEQWCTKIEANLLDVSFNMQGVRENRLSIPPPHVHCYIPERDPMADFNVSYNA